MHSATAMNDPDARAAAMARHPASRLSAASHRPPPEPGTTCSFAGLVELLSGSWRVQDPEGFSAAMTGAPLVGGHPVLGVADLGETPWAAAGDCWSAAALGRLRDGLAGAASRIEPRWVAGDRADRDGGRHLFVEARGQTAASAAGPALFVVAHLVERLGRHGERSRGRDDHSWVLMVVGDGARGVSGVVRAMLSCPHGCCAPSPTWARLPLTALRERLLAPAVSDLAPGAIEGPEATVIHLRRP
jgi:hypothetical protein